jgi:membrane protease YdiL (CAAX protease family)
MARRDAFRKIRLSAAEWKWGLSAALVSVAIVHASLVLLFRFVPLPTEELTSGYTFGSLAPWLAWVSIIVSALFAGVCEEVGFCGYMQAPLERRYGSWIAISVVSIVFTLVHLHQSWAPWLLVQLCGASVLWGILAFRTGSLIPGIIGHTLLDVLAFSYWYSDVGGRFERPTLAQVGIDVHFILWLFVFMASIILFYWFVLRIRAAALEANPFSSDGRVVV